MGVAASVEDSDSLNLMGIPAKEDELFAVMTNCDGTIEPNVPICTMEIMAIRDDGSTKKDD